MVGVNVHIRSQHSEHMSVTDCDRAMRHMYLFIHTNICRSIVQRLVTVAINVLTYDLKLFIKKSLFRVVVVINIEFNVAIYSQYRF